MSRQVEIHAVIASLHMKTWYVQAPGDRRCMAFQDEVRAHLAVMANSDTLSLRS